MLPSLSMVAAMYLSYSDDILTMVNARLDLCSLSRQAVRELESECGRTRLARQRDAHTRG